jgi:hypothetical protein
MPPGAGKVANTYVLISSVSKVGAGEPLSAIAL